MYIQIAMSVKSDDLTRYYVNIRINTRTEWRQSLGLKDTKFHFNPILLAANKDVLCRIFLFEVNGHEKPITFDFGIHFNPSYFEFRF